MTAYSSNFERAPLPSRERVAELLGRYPEVSNKDRREIVAFMRKGRHLDIGLLTSNIKLRPQLDRFMKDHQREFRLGVVDVVRMVAVLAASVVALWLMWELIRPVSL
ncbi:MAG TPA: hypothetical protein VJ597_08295 [Sphingomicrobium sp.]|nr:hypothetical protein [Sphingomicrobium sp.]